jgi:TonB family protein
MVDWIPPAEGLSLTIAAAIVGGVVLLLGVLRLLGIPPRLLFWTLLAHVAFVLAMGLVVYGQPNAPRAQRSDAMQVVLLPPIIERAEEEPVAVPRRQPIATRDATRPDRPTPPTALPRFAAGASVSAEYLGVPLPSVSSTMTRSAAASLNPEAYATRGLPTNRPEPGAIGGTALDAPPAVAPRASPDDRPAPIRRADPGRRVSVATPRSEGSGRARTPGGASPPSAGVALPRGVSFGGQVAGRGLRYFPTVPSVPGTEGGEVVLQFRVTPDGRVFSIRVQQKPGDPRMEREAARLVEQIQFEALGSRVQQVIQEGTITIAFRKDLQ